MWYLTSESDLRVIYITTEIRELVMGRSVENSTFSIPDDASISRKHAVFSISDENLLLQDLGSRYGTFVNNFVDRIEANSKVKLHNNDIVKFGRLNCVWKVNKVSFITCTSTLKGEQLQMLKENLKKLGGLLKNEWDDSCAYLTMPVITLTIKVVLALLQGSRIVTTNFWNKCVEAVNNQIPLPDPNDYIPQVVESTLNKEHVSFLPDHSRGVLFTGKKFIFFSRRQFDMYRAVLVKSSATPLLLSESQMTKSMLVNKDVIVIQYNLTNISQETQAQRNQINDIVNYLKSKGKRVIADAEIGLAVLYSSVSKYCNPDFNFSTEMLKQSSEHNPKTINTILAHESQETMKNQAKKENVIIDESLTSTDNTASTSSKRKLCDDDDITNNVKKKMATESIKNSENHGKRKLDDSNVDLSNPNKKVAVDIVKDDDDDEFFNFIKPVISKDNKNNVAEKKLTLSKPLNKKIQSVLNDGEDDLFNFIEDKSKPPVNEYSENILNMGKTDKQKELNTIKHNSNKNESVDISAMRGIKLKELLNNNKNTITDISNVTYIKKEEDDLDSKMNKLEIGSVVIKVRKDLVVKKEPLEIMEQHNPLRNFKKFKKVWPMKMQVTVNPKSSMNVFQNNLSM